VKRLQLVRVFDAFLPLLAVAGALIVGAIILLLLDTSPIEAYKVLLTGGFTSKNGMADTLVKAIPLLLVGLGKCKSRPNWAN
jgi:simple sugar transport system permease protein